VKYLVEFRNGGYLGPNTEAYEWSLAGGMAVKDAVVLSMDLALRLRETLGALVHGFDRDRKAELQALYREVDAAIHEARK
jgi:hypothetical protein